MEPSRWSAGVAGSGLDWVSICAAFNIRPEEWRDGLCTAALRRAEKICSVGCLGGRLWWKPMSVSAPPGPLIPDSSALKAEKAGVPADGGNGIGEMLGKYSRLVFSTALRRMRDEEGAKEVTQNVFL